MGARRTWSLSGATPLCLGCAVVSDTSPVVISLSLPAPAWTRRRAGKDPYKCELRRTTSRVNRGDAADRSIVGKHALRAPADGTRVQPHVAALRAARRRDARVPAVPLALQAARERFPVYRRRLHPILDGTSAGLALAETQEDFARSFYEPQPSMKPEPSGGCFCVVPALQPTRHSASQVSAGWRRRTCTPLQD